MGISAIELLFSAALARAACNGHKPCYALKMDIKRFFDSINHQTLKMLLCKKIRDDKILFLLSNIIDSFSVTNGPQGAVGIPLGNITSQIFANIYLHELDLFVKQTLRQRYYLRYCDDFIIVTNDATVLRKLIPVIRAFLLHNLQLELHPQKVVIRSLSHGIDFLGYVLFLHHRLMRSSTSQRMKRRLNKAYESFLQGKINATDMDQQLQSYLGLLSHANQHNLSQTLKNSFWVRKGGFSI
jgi:RNA-directed DNA polymerase